MNNRTINILTNKASIEYNSITNITKNISAGKIYFAEVSV